MAGFRVFFVSVEFRVFEIAREEVFFFYSGLFSYSSRSSDSPRFLHEISKTTFLCFVFRERLS